MKMFCGREYFDLVLKQETEERLFLIIYCRSLVKTGEKLRECCRQKWKRSRNFGKLHYGQVNLVLMIDY